MSIQAHKFISLMNHSVQRDARALAELEKLAETYPASHIVQAVLASLLKEEGNFDYTHRLRLAAITSPSRFALFKYLEGASTEIKPSLTQQVKEIQESEKITQVKTLMVPVEEEPEGEDTGYTIEKLAVEQEEKGDIPIVQTLQQGKEIREEEESSMLQQIVAVNIPLEEVEETQHDPVFIPAIKKEQVSADKLESIKNDPLEREIFSDAINRTIQHEVVQDALEDKQEVFEEEEQVNDSQSGFTYWLDPKKGTDGKRGQKMKQIDRLIENFIKNEPKIKPKKTQFFEPTKAARDSVKYDENLASEPLARIFEKQGFFERAIQIYEKLMVKFPEKKAYFAARIEKVQEVIKNIKNK